MHFHDAKIIVVLDHASLQFKIISSQYGELLHPRFQRIIRASVVGGLFRSLPY